MARRFEVAFLNAGDTDCKKCTLYHLPSYDFAGEFDFDILYEFCTNNQKNKLKRLEENRELEISLNINIGTLWSNVNSGKDVKEQKVYEKK